MYLLTLANCTAMDRSVLGQSCCYIICLWHGARERLTKAGTNISQVLNLYQLYAHFIKLLWLVN